METKFKWLLAEKQIATGVEGEDQRAAKQGTFDLKRTFSSIFTIHNSIRDVLFQTF